jgi:hypothetical protein
MKVMIFVKATKGSEAEDFGGQTEMMEAMGRYNEDLVAAGIMVDGDGLQPSSRGKRVVFDGKTRTVKDGPFPGDPNDLVAGFWIWNVKDINEAVEWVKKCPNPMATKSEIEIRPFYEMEDLADHMTPEMIAQEERLRDKLGNKH